MLSNRPQAERHGEPGNESLALSTSLVATESRRGGQQAIRDALLLIARSSAGAALLRQPTPALQTPVKPGTAPDAAPVTPMLSVGRLLPPRTASPHIQGTAASPTDSAMAITTRVSSRAAGAALLASPVRRRQAALSDLEAAKAKMADAMRQLRTCACELRIDLPAVSVGVVDAHSP